MKSQGIHIPSKFKDAHNLRQQEAARQVHINDLKAFREQRRRSQEQMEALEQRQKEHLEDFRKRQRESREHTDMSV